MKSKLAHWLLPERSVSPGFSSSASDTPALESVVCECLIKGADRSVNVKSPTRRIKKTVALYATMVVVSTCAIFLLEHATILNAFRTALVAAVGKTVAASWVTGYFD